MSPSPKFANEIARLMRDPDALRSERGQRPDGHGHYDPNQRASRPVTQRAASGVREDIAADIRIATRPSHELRSTWRNSLSSAQGIREMPMPKSSRLMDCSATLTPASISTARAVSSKPRTTPAETGECKISKPAFANDSASCRRDRPLPTESPAALNGWSRQPPMHTIERPARTPQFGRLLRVQWSS
jgi:hypothetical protein